ncbi:MAG: hypothetical protein PHQ27_07665 [Victivallales bacterium]|nr:hypothetical protein [Victivallales bacterium]
MHKAIGIVVLAGMSVWGGFSAMGAETPPQQGYKLLQVVPKSTLVTANDTIYSTPAGLDPGQGEYPQYRVRLQIAYDAVPREDQVGPNQDRGYDRVNFTYKIAVAVQEKTAAEADWLSYPVETVTGRDEFCNWLGGPIPHGSNVANPWYLYANTAALNDNNRDKDTVRINVTNSSNNFTVRLSLQRELKLSGQGELSVSFQPDYDEGMRLMLGPYAVPGIFPNTYCVTAAGIAEQPCRVGYRIPIQRKMLSEAQYRAATTYHQPEQDYAVCDRKDISVAAVEREPADKNRKLELRFRAYSKYLPPEGPRRLLISFQAAFLCHNKVEDQSRICRYLFECDKKNHRVKLVTSNWTGDKFIVKGINSPQGKFFARICFMPKIQADTLQIEVWIEQLFYDITSLLPPVEGVIPNPKQPIYVYRIKLSDI